MAIYFNILLTVVKAIIYLAFWACSRYINHRVGQFISHDKYKWWSPPAASSRWKKWHQENLLCVLGNKRLQDGQQLHENEVQLILFSSQPNLLLLWILYLIYLIDIIWNFCRWWERNNINICIKICVIFSNLILKYSDLNILLIFYLWRIRVWERLTYSS